MAIQELSIPLEIDSSVISRLAEGRKGLNDLVQGNLPIFIIAEDTSRKICFIGNKAGKQVFPVSRKLFFKKQLKKSH